MKYGTKPANGPFPRRNKAISPQRTQRNTKLIVPKPGRLPISGFCFSFLYSSAFSAVSPVGLNSRIEVAHLLQVGAGSGGMPVLDMVCRDPRIARVTLIEPDLYKP